MDKLIYTIIYKRIPLVRVYGVIFVKMNLQHMII